MVSPTGRLERPSRPIYSVFEGHEDGEGSSVTSPPLTAPASSLDERLSEGDPELGIGEAQGHGKTSGKGRSHLLGPSRFRLPGSSRHFAYTSVADEDDGGDDGSQHDPTGEDKVPGSILLEVPSQFRQNAKKTPNGSRQKGPPALLSLRQKVRQAAHKPFANVDPKQRALWMWVNVQDPDRFLQDAYNYYTGKGAYCILLSKVINLFTIGFVISFSTFLLGCVDYSRLVHSKRLSDAVVDHCVARFSTIQTVILVLIISVYGWRVLGFHMDIRSLLDLKAFYEHLLHVSDSDIQSIPWPEVVKRIQAIKDENPAMANASASAQGSGQANKWDAHDVANRIMRAENYLIALFNKDVVNLQVPEWLPIPYFKGRPLLTRALEWNLGFCLLGFLLDSRGQVRSHFMQMEHRESLVEGLKRRFYFMALLNAIFAPVIVVYMLMYTFLRYFEEYHKNPSSFGGRQYTQFALWKFREFNELPHAFRRRIRNSYPLAQAYIDQFPKEKTVLIARVVAFVAGSFTAVLLLVSVLHPELALTLEISPGRTVLFYLGICGTILAIARGQMPDEKTVWDHEDLISGVIEHTHYLPSDWQDQLHSERVRQEFGHLFQLKIVNFFEEIVSVILTPFVLCWSLPKSSENIIDFFREFTLHVEGLGYVCSFAVFDFERHGDSDFGVMKAGSDEMHRESEDDGEGDDDDEAPTTESAQTYAGPKARKKTSTNGKMEQSIINFKQQYPEWSPQDPATSQYLNKVSGQAEQSQMHDTRSPVDSRTSLNHRSGGGGGSRMIGSQLPHLSTLMGPGAARMSTTIYNNFGPPGMAESMFLTSTGMGGGTAALVEYNKRTKRLASKMDQKGNLDREKTRKDKGRKGSRAGPASNDRPERHTGNKAISDKSPQDQFGGSSYGDESILKTKIFGYDEDQKEGQGQDEVDSNDPFRDETVVGILNQMYDRGGHLRPSG